MLSRRATFWLLYLPPLLWLLAFFVAPLGLMAAFSFRNNMRGGIWAGWTPSLEQYEALFAQASYWRLLGISILIAFVVALIAVILAYPIAYYLTFKAGKRAGLYLILLLVPFWTSYLLRVMAWKIMLGSDGVINSFLQYLHLISEPTPLLLYNRSAVVLTLNYVWIPFVTLPVLAALQRIDVSLFEAAADLGATPFRTFWRITFPMSLPGVLAAFFMVFIPSVGEYVTPLLVGGSRGTLYGNIVQDFFTKAGNWPFGSAMSIVMLVVTVILVALAARLINLRDLVRSSRMSHRLPTGLGIYYFGLLALLYLPIAVLFLFSINANTSLSFPLQGFTLDWYGQLLNSGAMLVSVRNSLLVAIGSSTAATVLGAMVAILTARYQFRSKLFLLALTALPLVVPFVVLGVALLLMFSAIGLERSLWTVGIGHTVVALPYTLLIITARLAGFDPYLEEAAMDLGADYPTALRRIVLPIIAPAMVSAWLTAFTVSFDEFALALFLAGTEPTFPVYLFSQLRFANRLPLMIALAVLLMIATLTIVVVGEKVRRTE